MKAFDKSINWLDRFQRRHPWLAFAHAVIKRYGEDRVGYQAALLTYYAFLSLFPLLLVLTTLTQLVVGHDTNLQLKIIHAVTNYFPVLGSQLSAHIHGLHRNGIALIIGLLVIFYGARGVADVFRYGANQIWRTTAETQSNFFDSTIKSLKIICIGGLGLIIASIAAGLTTDSGHSLIFRLLSLCVTILSLFGLFAYVLRISLPRRIRFRELRVAAISAVLGLIVLQLLGGYLFVRILKNLDALYSYFALALGLISWLYLQAEMVYYAMEIAVVKTYKLWPRSLSGKQLTKADLASVSQDKLPRTAH